MFTSAPRIAGTATVRIVDRRPRGTAPTRSTDHSLVDASGSVRVGATIRRLLIAATVLFAFMAMVAHADGASKLPVAANGERVSVVARGIASPSQFAFSGKTLFVASGGTEGKVFGTTTGGGLYAITGGNSVRLTKTPTFGVAWSENALYVSAGATLSTWKGWNGTAFATHKVIYQAPKGSTGLTGLAFGSDGRLYTGVYLGALDWQKGTTPYANDILSFKADGSDMKVVATGIRQPWMLAFAANGSLYATDLAQNAHAVNPRDAILRIKAGDRFGFPACNWTDATAEACGSFTKPAILLAKPHASPMGISAAGNSLYVAIFGQASVVKYASPTSTATPVMTGFPAPPIALAVRGGTVYAGDSSGTIYRSSL